MTASAEVLSYLDGLGSRLDEFDQGARQAEARITAGQVDEGFCRGICTDWLRRVIQGGNPWYDPAIQRIGGPPKPTKTPAQVADRKEQQTLRMASLHMHTGGNTLPATTFQERLRKARKELADLYNRNLEASELAIPADLLQRVHEFQGFEDRAKYSMGFIQKVLKSMKEMILEADPDQSWSSVAAAMDTHFADKRTEAGRHEPRKPFSGITAGLAQVARENYHGLDAASDALLKADGFVPGAGLIAGFRISVPKGREMQESGHAIAVFKLNENLFYFFDPNYAIHRYTRTAVVQAIEYLFGRIYQENGWRVLNADGFCSMRLSVFHRA